MASDRDRFALTVGVALAASAASAGCASLRVQLVDASVRRPSNIALYFTVERSNGEPVADLLPPNFTIYEDGAKVSAQESQATLLQKQVAAVHYTLLLVDMSGSVVGSGQIPTLMAAASTFARRVGPQQKVAIFAFDGSPHLTPIIPFGGDVQAGVAALASWKVKDPSTNLNGAVIEGLGVLDRQMDLGEAPLRFGTLVVFTDGTDHAHRATAEAVRKALDGSATDVYVIATGAEINENELAAIGRAGAFTSRNPTDIARGFDDVGRRIEDATRRYYLLSYCSPSRAGEHELTVEVDEKGTRGRLRHRFKADGFGPGCDPNTRPAFDVRHPRRRSAPPRTRGAAASEEAAPAARDGGSVPGDRR